MLSRYECIHATIGSSHGLRVEDKSPFLYKIGINNERKSKMIKHSMHLGQSESCSEEGDNADPFFSYTEFDDVLIRAPKGQNAHSEMRKTTRRSEGDRKPTTTNFLEDRNFVSRLSTCHLEEIEKLWSYMNDLMYVCMCVFV